MEIPYKIIKDISDKITYIQLCACIMPPAKFGVTHPMAKQTFFLVNRFIKSAPKEEILTKGIAIINLIDPLLQTSLKNFPPRKSIEDVATKFKSFQKENPEYSNNGIIYGWLNDLIDCRKLYVNSLPSHAKVGTHIHAGKFAIEESIIIRDAFFFLLMAHKEMKKLKAFVARPNSQSVLSNKKYSRAMLINTNIGSFCRTAHLNFYSFVEAFVNGVGLDYLYKNKSCLNQKDQDILMGRVNNKYISIERKIELYPQIIRPDKKRVLFLTDSHQIKFPFKKFFTEGKNLRDSSVHFSSLKEPIVRRPQEWLEKADEYSKLSLEVAKEFWEACYQTKKYPDYLDLLDYSILTNIASKRYEESFH
jgi:hypothetical protein